MAYTEVSKQLPFEQPDATHEVDTVADWQEPPLWELVGRTPLIPLPVPACARSRESSLLLKAEWLNPGGSVKDRPAREILCAGIAEGACRPAACSTRPAGTPRAGNYPQPACQASAGVC